MKKLLVVTLLVAFGVALGKRCEAEETMAGEKSPAKTVTAAPAAATTPKPVSRSEEILKRFDKNGDGRLDDDEKADAHEIMLEEQMAKEAPPASVQSLAHFQELALELFDRNHDGRIDDTERDEATAFIERGDVAVTRETLLNRFDTNRDGKLDDNERREARAYAVEHRGELMQEVLLKRYDANGNGRLEPEEKMAIRAAFMSTLVSPGAVLEDSAVAAPKKPTGSSPEKK